MKRIVIFAVVLSLWTGAAMADTVVLKNGDRLTGTIDSIAGGRLVLATEYAGHVPIQLDQVAEVVSEAAFDVRTSAGEVSGRFAVADGAQQIAVFRPHERCAVLRRRQRHRSSAPPWL